MEGEAIAPKKLKRKKEQELTVDPPEFDRKAGGCPGETKDENNLETSLQK